MKNRVLALVLTLALAVSLVPHAALAEASFTKVLVDDANLYLALIFTGDTVRLNGTHITMTPGDVMEVDCYSKSSRHTYSLLCAGEAQARRIQNNMATIADDHQHNSAAVRSIPESSEPHPTLAYDEYADSYCYYYRAEREGTCPFLLEAFAYPKGVVNGKPASAYSQMYTITVEEE